MSIFIFLFSKEEWQFETVSKTVSGEASFARNSLTVVLNFSSSLAFKVMFFGVFKEEIFKSLQELSSSVFLYPGDFESEFSFSSSSLS